jgi:hypothetical protein
MTPVTGFIRAYGTFVLLRRSFEKDDLFVARRPEQHPGLFRYAYLLYAFLEVPDIPNSNVYIFTYTYMFLFLQ